jgi:hypothetical protein
VPVNVSASMIMQLVSLQFIVILSTSWHLRCVAIWIWFEQLLPWCSHYRWVYLSVRGRCHWGRLD